MFFFIIPSGESYCNDRSKEFSEKIFMRGGPSIMATTRIMPLHVGKGRTESRAIRQNPLTESCFVWRLTTHYHKVLLTLKNC